MLNKPIQDGILRLDPTGYVMVNPTIIKALIFLLDKTDRVHRNEADLIIKELKKDLVPRV